jgi:predicted phage tail protein
VSPLPLLSAPEFLPATGDFKADQFGHLKLNWTQIQGAQEYWIVLMDAEGKEIRRARYQGTSTAVNNLLPGQYQISVHAVDAHGRESEKSPPRSVTVSDKSGLQAPKFKRIEVK